MNLKRCLAAALVLCGTTAHAATDLYFSEYIEGSSNNKALEIHNNTGAAVDLSAYEVQVYFNGNTSANLTLPLSGTLPQGEVHVLGHASAVSAILDQADQTNGAGWFNGNDAVVLLNGGAPVDAIGQIGADPGSQWGSGDTSTQNNTLRRLPEVDDGDSDPYDAFDPSVQWTGFPQDTFDGLGSHGGGTEPEAGVLINEADADTAGTDTAEFVELYDGGAGNTALDGLTLVFFNGNGDASYAAYDLDGFSTDADGYFVLGNADVAEADIVFGSNALQNGADAVALYLGDAADFPDGTPVTTASLVDALVYDTNDSDDAGLLTLLNAGEAQVNEGGGGDKDAHSNQRCADGAGGPRVTSGYGQAAPTPGAANSCEAPPVSACGEPATPISSIQGAGAASPLSGSRQTVEAVVTAAYQGGDGLDGFFVQEEDADQDADPATSEGVFVYAGSPAVNVGDRVRLTGNVTEYYDLTELTGISGFEVCASGVSVSPATVELPVADRDDLEAFEGMSVVFPQTLTVSENYDLGRYGELLLAAGGRLYQGTNVAAPGEPAQAVEAENVRRSILLDDGSADQNPDPIIYPAPELSAYNTVRNGDTVQGIQGVINYAYGEYRIQPRAVPTFVSTNPRTAAPKLEGTGSLRVASFNVLNYFNGDGMGGGFPTARGADTLEELQRQQAKLATAITAVNADVIGLMEIENDGYGAESAIAQLVDALNAAGGSYAYVDPGMAAIGGDEIAVGLLYNTETVAEAGNAAILDSGVDSRYVDTKNRPALAQAFRERATGEVLTVAVNHLKSKGSSCEDIGDPDTGDGQGNCNATRTAAAEAEVDWLAGDPTGSGDEDVLIIGDLNAYAQEDPISAIKNAGYTDLLDSYIGEQAYSYVYFGRAGYLDHALANASLAEQVTDTTVWHINPDEPRALDYDTDYKSPEQVVELYDTHAYRASDHDPVVVELALESALPGDFNGNGRLGLPDFFRLLGHLTRNAAVAGNAFDLTGDGRVDGRDIGQWFSLYRAQWH